MSLGRVVIFAVRASYKYTDPNVYKEQQRERERVVLERCKRCRPYDAMTRGAIICIRVKWSTRSRNYMISYFLSSPFPFLHWLLQKLCCNGPKAKWFAHHARQMQLLHRLLLLPFSLLCVLSSILKVTSLFAPRQSSALHEYYCFFPHTSSSLSFN